MGSGPLLAMFVAMLAVFLGTRLVTRRIQAGGTRLRNWEAGGVHLHHQVFGIIALLVSGGLEFAYRPPAPWAEVLGAVFGAGASLTLDEFALWLHLSDVYWTPEGRKSVDAVFVAVLITGLLLVGATPVSAAPGEAAYLVALLLALNLVLCALAILKGKAIVGIVGLVLPLVALVGCLRLAKPASPWARWRYRPGSRKLARSAERFGPAYQARWNRVRDLIGGAPTARGS